MRSGAVRTIIYHLALAVLRQRRMKSHLDLHPQPALCTWIWSSLRWKRDQIASLMCSAYLVPSRTQMNEDSGI
ncbi:hypothetical protein ANANG_G00140900 [Anguilla anguilla]|uniref:Uncharacterized protein n=1 Tax=Anguilla anguilla TaxID=7936 RepID=A0A9D3RXZ6_ANGAN|nr:hypothetical protein ANANG_G00140900 [Anguilla anguilla]